MDDGPLNPYDTPDTIPVEEPQGPVSLPDGPYGPYRDNRVLARWVVGALLVYGLFVVFWAVVNLLCTYSVAASSSETLDRIVTGAEAVSWVTIGTFVVFGVWIVRSAKNAWLFGQLKRRLSSRGKGRYQDFISTTPGWCVGWYFIPIANFWKPYVAMREIVRTSTTGQKIPGYLMPFWWTLWLLSSLGDSLTGDTSSSFTSNWDVHVSAAVWTSASGINMALTVIALQLIRTTTRLQHDSAVHFSAMDPDRLKSGGPLQDHLTGTFLDR